MGAVPDKAGNCWLVPRFILVVFKILCVVGSWQFPPEG